MKTAIQIGGSQQYLNLEHLSKTALQLKRTELAWLRMIVYMMVIAGLLPAMAAQVDLTGDIPNLETPNGYGRRRSHQI
jgi:hypothetical protein